MNDKNYKLYYSNDLGCGYRWDSEYKVLEFCPMLSNGNLEFDNWNPVDEDLVGDEMVYFMGEDMTLSQVYRIVEKVLGVK